MFRFVSFRFVSFRFIPSRLVFRPLRSVPFLVVVLDSRETILKADVLKMHSETIHDENCVNVF